MDKIIGFEEKGEEIGRGNGGGGGGGGVYLRRRMIGNGGRKRKVKSGRKSGT